MLNNLQILRALAAVGVVFYHTGFLLWGDYHTEFFGVPIFFVISGFVMSYIQRENPQIFLLKRVIRIVPLYWTATFVMLVVACRQDLFLLQTYTSTNLIPDLIQSLLFLPNPDHFPTLGVGWTLNYEMYFYLIFAISLLINLRFAPVIAAFAVGITPILNIVSGGNFVVQGFYSSPLVLYFVAGIAVFYLRNQFKGLFLKRSMGLISVCIVCFLLVSNFVTPLFPKETLSFLWLPPVIIVFGAIMSEISGFSLNWRPLLLIGEASYSLYLFHEPVFETLRLIAPKVNFPDPGLNVLSMLTYVGISILVGICLHIYLEKPMLAFFRSIFHTTSSHPSGK